MITDSLLYYIPLFLSNEERHHVSPQQYPPTCVMFWLVCAREEPSHAVDIDFYDSSPLCVVRSAEVDWNSLRELPGETPRLVVAF